MYYSGSYFSTTYSTLNMYELINNKDMTNISIGVARNSFIKFFSFLLLNYKCIGRIYCFTCKGLKRTGYDTQHDYCCEAWKLFLVITLCRSNIILSLCDTTVVIYFQLLSYTVEGYASSNRIFWCIWLYSSHITTMKDFSDYLIRYS